jgi:flagellar biosynthesis regulator FlaF
VDEALSRALADVRSSDRSVQNSAYQAVMEATDVPVAWAYEVWERVVADLRNPDNHVRAIAAQLLCNLAKSDPEQRIVRDFPALLEVTRDSRFVTARHCLQSLWKVGAVGGAPLETYRAGLVSRFAECRAEKNWSLIRYDIVHSFRNLYDASGDESIRSAALELIGSEDDVKYRKKYAGVWKSATSGA